MLGRIGVTTQSLLVSSASGIVPRAVQARKGTAAENASRRPIVKREGLAGRVVFLFAFAFVPIALFVIIPALNTSVLAGTAGETIGRVIVACAFAALIALRAWARYVWRPRHPEVFERLEHLHERGDS